MSYAVEVKNLKKNYGDIQAVNDISFYVEEGSLFAFLGPNGAGKSTTINILCTLLTYNDGSACIDGFELGKDDAKIRKQIGIVFQDTVLDPLLTIYENLWTRGKLYNIDDQTLSQAIDEALSITEITDIKDRRFGKLSGGQKRRADIARALINHPKILFLDEPTTGLDPQTRKSVWSTIHELQKQKNMTVFLTTHYLEEANDADYVVIIDHGQIAAKGTPTELKNIYSSDVLEIKPLNMKDFISKMDSSLSYTIHHDIIRIEISDSLASLSIIQKYLDQIESFQVIGGSLDDAFIRITGKEIKS